MTTLNEDTCAELVGALSTLVRNGRAVTQRIVGSVDNSLSAPAFALLKGLDVGGEMRLAELAQRVNSDLSVVSRQVTALEQSGYAVRQQDPEDGRATLISMTDAGREAMSAMLSTRTHWLRTTMDGWTEEEARTLVGFLNRLNDDVSRASE